MMPSQLRPRNRAAYNGDMQEDAMNRAPTLWYAAAQIGLGLLTGAIFPSCVCDTGDDPLTVRTDNVEQVGAAVVDLAVHQKLERSPHHRQIVIDPHERIMNSLLNLRGARFSYPVRKIFKSHLSRFAVPH